MKYLGKTLMMFLFTLTQLALGNPSATQEIKVDDANFKALYGKNIETMDSEFSQKSQVDLFKFKISSLSFNELVLENSYFKVPYSDFMKSTPLLEFVYLSELWKGQRLGVYISGGVGYSYMEKRISLLPPEGVRIDDLIKTHRIPLSVGPVVEYTPLDTDFFSVYFGPKLGIQWFYQSGKVDGATQNFLVTMYEAEAGIKLFGTNKKDSILTGVNIFSSVLGTFSSSQKVSGMKIGLGAHLNL